MRGLQTSPQRVDAAARGWDFGVPHHLFLPEGRAKMREVIKRNLEDLLRIDGLETGFFDMGRGEFGGRDGGEKA